MHGNLFLLLCLLYIQYGSPGGQRSHDGGKYEHIQFFVMETSRLGLVASRDEVERTRSEIKKTGKSHEQSLTCDVGGPEI